MAKTLWNLCAESIIENCNDIKSLNKILPVSIVSEIQKRAKYMSDVIKYIKDQTISNIIPADSQYANTIWWLRGVDYSDMDLHTFIKEYLEPNYNNSLCTCMHCDSCTIRLQEIVVGFVIFRVCL